MNSRISALLPAAALLAMAPGAFAFDDYGRWYATVMATAIDADDKREVETEISGYHLGVGRGFGSDWGVELNHVGTRFKNAADKRTLMQYGFGVDVTRRFAQTQFFAPYLVGGAGWMYSDYKINRYDRDGAMASFGAGLKIPVARNVSLRTELRARRDFGDSAVTDLLLSVGVQVPFASTYIGPAPRPPLADGTPHPESKAQPYGWVGDRDGDGVPDHADQCPDSPAGVWVDQYGCAIADDADGDGVPNSRDICPDTGPGEPVDKHGCRIDPPRQMDRGQ
jgi:OmpA-OmpF porin, OOP family